MLNKNKTVTVLVFNENILDKWEIPYVDLSEETELTGDNEEITTQYFRYNATTKKATGFTLLHMPI